VELFAGVGQTKRETGKRRAQAEAGVKHRRRTSRTWTLEELVKAEALRDDDE